MRNTSRVSLTLLVLVLAVCGLGIGSVASLDIPAPGAPLEASTCVEGRGCSTSAQCGGGQCFRHKCFC